MPPLRNRLDGYYITPCIRCKGRVGWCLELHVVCERCHRRYSDDEWKLVGTVTRIEDERDQDVRTN